MTIMVPKVTVVIVYAVILSNRTKSVNSKSYSSNLNY